MYRPSSERDRLLGRKIGPSTARPAGEPGNLFGREVNTTGSWYGDEQEKKKKELFDLATLSNIDVDKIKQKALKAGGSALGKLGDILSTGSYASAGASRRTFVPVAKRNDLGELAKAVGKRAVGLDLLDVLKGAKEGVKQKTTYKNVAEDLGVRGGNATALGFAGDVLLDPTTYISLGSAKGISMGGKTLSKGGERLLAKALAKGKFGRKEVTTALQKSTKTIGEDAARKAVFRAAAKNPDKYLRSNIANFAGKRLVSHGAEQALGRAGKKVASVPGIRQAVETGTKGKNLVGSLFSRDYSLKYGKLPEDWIGLKQRYLDKAGYDRSKAIEGVLNIAKKYKLNEKERNLVMSAIESKKSFVGKEAQEIGRAGKKAARLEGAKGELENVFSKMLEREKRAGIGVRQLGDETLGYAPHTALDDSLKGTIPFKPEGARVSLGAKEARMFKGTAQDINRGFKKPLFETDIIKAGGTRAVDSSKAVNTSKFLNETAEKFGVDSAKAPAGYVEAGAKELKGKSFHPAIAKEIDTFKKQIINDEATNKLFKTLDGIQNYWKGSVTVPFSAFHGRNALSNVMQNWLDIGKDSLNPFIAKDTAKILTSDVTKKAPKGMMVDKFGKEHSLKDIKKAAEETGVVSNKYLFSDITDSVEQELNKGLKSVRKGINPLSRDNYLFRTGGKIGETIETQARLQNFMSNIKKGMTVDQAAKQTKKFLFDYGNLSNAEKSILRRIFPFYTWTRKNLELQARELVRQPGKYAGMYKLDRAASQPLSEEEQQGLAPWVTQGFKTKIGETSQGDPRIAYRYGTPLEGAVEMLNPSKKAMDMLSPLIKFPLEKKTRHNFFRQGTIEDRNYITNEDQQNLIKKIPALKDFLHYKERKTSTGKTANTVDPDRLHTLEGIVGRVFSDTAKSNAFIDALKSNKDKRDTFNRAVQILSGVKVEDVDIERGKEFKQREIEDQIKEELKREGLVAETDDWYEVKDYNNAEIPAGEPGNLFGREIKKPKTIQNTEIQKLLGQSSF